MNTEYVIAAIERLVDAKVNGTSQGVRQAQKELRKAFGEADLAPCAAKLKVDFEEDLPPDFFTGWKQNHEKILVELRWLTSMKELGWVFR